MKILALSTPFLKTSSLALENPWVLISSPLLSQPPRGRACRVAQGLAGRAQLTLGKRQPCPQTLHPQRAWRKWLARESRPRATWPIAHAPPRAASTAGFWSAPFLGLRNPRLTKSCSRHLAAPSPPRPSRVTFFLSTLSAPLPCPYPSVSRAAAAETAPSPPPHSPRGTRSRAYKCS